jgi:hypothetical protein
MEIIGKYYMPECTFISIVSTLWKSCLLWVYFIQLSVFEWLLLSIFDHFTGYNFLWCHNFILNNAIFWQLLQIIMVHPITQLCHMYHHTRKSYLKIYIYLAKRAPIWDTIPRHSFICQEYREDRKRENKIHLCETAVNYLLQRFELVN